MTLLPLDLTPFRDTIDSLDRALDLVTDDDWFRRQPQAARETLIAGVIQNFEFVFELSIKSIKRQLELDAEDPELIDLTPFRDILRMAAEKGLIEGVEAWFEYRKMRNRSSHTYDQAKAIELYQEVPAFLADAQSLFAQLEVRNV